VKFTFECDHLDERNWTVDFGSLKTLKAYLQDTFDHKTLVAIDDPELGWFKAAHERGIIDLVEVPATGCEKFAEMIFQEAQKWLEKNEYTPRCRLVEVEVKEHGANSAIYRSDTTDHE
jgi:6-pyruvoyltetrahydropterin/6-carboxytetrahydropterin synthase